MKRFLPLALTLIALAVVPTAASATTFGAEVNTDFTNQSRGAWPEWMVQNNLNALYKAGGRVGRAESNWSGTEPKAPVHGRHQFNWHYDDMIVLEMAAAHLRWEPTLAFAPRWAQGRRSNVIHTSTGRWTAFLPPVNFNNFAIYATAFMKRYGPNGVFWKAYRKKLPYLPVTTVEVWNEPDNLFDWGQHIDLGAYANMYEVVRSAVHRVDRRARVMTGGLAWLESSLPRLLNHFAGKPMDALAIHPYGSTPGVTVQHTRDAQAMMRRWGRGRTPISANEYGWTSIRGTWGSINPRKVKGYAYSALLGLGKLGLSEIEPYAWSDPSWGLSTGSFAKAIAKLTHHSVSHRKVAHRR